MLRFEGIPGVEEDLGRGLPVARRTTPAVGMLRLGGLIEGVAPGQQVALPGKATSILTPGAGKDHLIKSRA